ncbi:MAG: hypothetical protein AAGM22_18645 [Acidobacteriota bacterium]
MSGSSRSRALDLHAAAFGDSMQPGHLHGNSAAAEPPTLEFAMVCTAKGCACGKPIVIRMINGKRTPIHI